MNNTLLDKFRHKKEAMRVERNAEKLSKQTKIRLGKLKLSQN